MTSKNTVSYTKYKSLKTKAEAWKENCLEISNEKSQLELANENLEQQIELLQDEILMFKDKISELEENDSDLETKYKQLKKKNREHSITIETQKQNINLYLQMISQNMMKNNI